MKRQDAPNLQCREASTVALLGNAVVLPEHGRPARTFARARVPERGPARTFARALVPARQFARERVPARPRDPEPARVAALVESPPEQVEAQQPALAVEPPGEAPPTAEDPLEPPAHPTTAGCCSS
eukprot:385247_1